MALNRLYSDHQRALMLGERSGEGAERTLQMSVAARIARQIGETQRALDAPAAPGWLTLATAADGERAE